jgi:hypothetical protein
MTDHPQANRPRSAETARAQEIEDPTSAVDADDIALLLMPVAEEFRSLRVQLRSAQERLTALDENRDRWKARAEQAETVSGDALTEIRRLVARITEMESALQARASSGAATCACHVYEACDICRPAQAAPTVATTGLDEMSGSFDIRTVAAEYGWCYQGQLVDWIRRKLEQLKQLQAHPPPPDAPTRG